MKNSLTKRLAAIVLTLAMLLGCASALAETTAFEQNLMQRLNQIDLTNQQLVLTADPSLFGSEASLSLQVVGGLADCKIQAGGVDVEAQSDGQTIWVSVGEDVYALSIADLEHLFQDIMYVNPLYRLQNDPRFSRKLSNELSGLVQKVLLPGITLGRDEDGNTQVTVNLTGRQILDGLADWLDAEVEAFELDQREMHVFELLINAYATVQPYSGFSSPEDALEQIKTAVHEAAQQLRETEVDLTITGTITILSNGLNAALVLTVDGQAANLDIEAAEEDGNVNFKLALYDERYEYLTLSGYVDSSDEGTDVHVGLNLPMNGIEAIFDASIKDDSIGANLTVLNWGVTVFYASLNAEKTDDKFYFSLNAEAQDNEVLDVNGTVYFTEKRAVLFIEVPNFKLQGEVSEDEQGRHPWSVNVTSGSSYSTSTYAFSWDGETFTVEDSVDVQGWYSINTVEKFHGREISDTEYAIDVTMIQTYKGEEPDEQTAVVLLKLTDGENGAWKLDIDAETNGETQHGLTLEITGQTGVEPLANKVTQALTEQDIVNAVFSLLMPSASNYYYDYNY